MKKVLLCILDGFGIDNVTQLFLKKMEYRFYNTISDNDAKKNPIILAKMNTFFSLIEKYPYTFLNASGKHVGLLKNQMGNSEIGHTTIGLGRKKKSNLLKINELFKNSNFEYLPELQNIINYHLKYLNKNCHLFSILSDGCVHGSIYHLINVINILSKFDINIKLHLVSDGRDTPPCSVKKYIYQLKKSLNHLKNVHIATIGGRYYAMDRDTNWDRTIKPYKAIMFGYSETKFVDVYDFIQKQYQLNISDEFIEYACHENYKGMDSDDSFFICNFRKDRLIQIAKLFSDNLFASKLLEEFNTNRVHIEIKQLYSMTYINESFKNIIKDESSEHTLGYEISKNKLKQLRISETEKYAHVTYFLNNYREEPYPFEDRILIKSSGAKSYDKNPEMEAYKLTEKVITKIESQFYNFICVNYPNCDMVGHTGNFDACITACKTIDRCLSLLYDKCTECNVDLIVTSDHGNIESVFDEKSKQRHTYHTTNLVPFIYIGSKKIQLSQIYFKNSLANIAPTILELLDIKQNEYMEKSLII